jgi:hypothetical protein
VVGVNRLASALNTADCASATLSALSSVVRWTKASRSSCSPSAPAGIGRGRGAVRDRVRADAQLRWHVLVLLDR